MLKYLMFINDQQFDVPSMGDVFSAGFYLDLRAMQEDVTINDRSSVAFQDAAKIFCAS